MGKIKETKRNLFITTITMALAFSAILGTMPSTSAQNGDMQTQLPDIKITDITFSNEEPVEDEEITISANVLNNGSMPASNITITFFLDNEEIWNVTDLIIDANESMFVNITWMTEKWDHNISAMLSIDDVKLMNTMIGKYIYVEAKPIGDIPSLIYALILIMMVVFGTAVVPSILRRLKDGNSKREM